MQIVAYIIAWNEERMIRHTLNYYTRFCQKIVLMDNLSTDRTVAIAKAFPQVEVRSFDTGNTFDEGLLGQVRNNAWKECRGKDVDYVIMCDADEFLYEHPSTLMSKFAQLKERGVAIPGTYGIAMYSEFFPMDYSRTLPEQIKEGLRDEGMDKRIVFSPQLVQEMNFGPGAHHCDPIPNIKSEVPSFLLLHYKYLSVEYLEQKHRIYAARLSAWNKARGYCSEYLDPAHIKYVMETLKSRKTKVI